LLITRPPGRRAAGPGRWRFFQELKLHLQFPGFPFEFVQPRAFLYGYGRLFQG
jgi:hypothetical protein